MILVTDDTSSFTSIHSVWEVSRDVNHGHYWSVGLYATRELALLAVEGELKWIEDYHGPHYPVMWRQPSLALDGPSEWIATPYYGKVKVEERVVVNQTEGNA